MGEPVVMSAQLQGYLLPFLDISTIGLCIVCKLPQILAICKTKSLKGVSVNGVMVELLAYSIILGYNLVQGYPLTSFLEYVFLALEDIILIFVIFYFMGTLDVVKVGGVGIFVTLFYGFTQGIPHPSVLPLLMKFATPCSASSKLLQLKEIWRLKNSDSVSVLTWLIASYTCVSRITTNLMLTGDVPLLINYAVALTLNSSIILLALYYRRGQSDSKISLESKDKSGNSNLEAKPDSKVEPRKKD